jgi:hypothetical protein
MRFEKYTQRIVTVLWVLFLCSWGRLAAQPGPPLIEYVKPLTGAQLAVQAAVTVENDLFFNNAYSANIDRPYPVKNIVTLKLNEAYNGYFSAPFTATVTLNIVYTNASEVQDSITRDFVVRYDTAVHKAQDLFVFNNAQRVTLRVINIQVLNNAGQPVTPAANNGYLVIENKMQVQPRYKFNCAITSSSLVVTDSAKATPDELYVSWTDVQGSHEYDLEWTYIDSSALSNHVYGNPADITKIFDNNASRVSLSGTQYAIPLMYNDAGTLFVRVRSVQYAGEKRLEANWTVTPSAGQYDFKGHQRNLNWQSATSYAEDGKRKVVVQYFDGSLRSRQTVTKDNILNRTVVAESLYDYQGRPVIQVLPVPTLNNIISYTRQFNVAINGGEYDKNYYDSLPDPAAYCSTSASPMGTQNGASQYYSPANPEKSGLNKYIPDAENYPFTEVQYTQDATGRISKQGGVGAGYQPGSGHETRYFYNTPSQAELDGLFGTEAGDKSHYFKNAVRDANGQFSVSYTDMHGRTVATALAGGTPTGMEALSSNTSAHTTEQLADSNSAIFRDRTIEHKKSLLVETAGDHIFRYKLDPETLSKETCDSSICYNCLYDLKITVTDDCNNQKLPLQKPFEKVVHNFRIDSLGTNCTASSLEAEFTLFLVPGSYEITKHLTVSQYAIDTYRDSVFVPNNTCTTLQTVINEQRSLVLTGRQCTPTCESCLLNLGTWEQFRQRFMDSSHISNADSAKFRSQALASFSEAQDACTALCGTRNDGENIRKAMLLDLTPPSGQYADLARLQFPYSIFYKEINAPARYQQSTIKYLDAAGKEEYVIDDRKGILVKPNELDSLQFISKFNPAWATALLPLHPEYCKLLKYELFEASHNWDVGFEKTDTYLEALGNGYLNPTANTSGTPPFNRFTAVLAKKDPLATAGYTSQLETKLNVYIEDARISGLAGFPIDVDLSIWTMACMSAKLNGTDTTGTYICYVRPFHTSLFCEGELDMAWRNFRNLYLQAKKDLVNQLVNNACPNLSLPVNYTPNFNNAASAVASAGLNYNDLSQQDIKNVAGDKLAALYEANCQAYVETWMQQLLACPAYAGKTASMRSVLMPRLVQVCKEGTDINHSNGASTVKPSSSNTYRSFEDAILAYNLEYDVPTDSVCNPELITTHKPYDRPTSYSSISLYSKPDSCQCKTIQDINNSYQQNNQGQGSLSAYIKFTRKTDISEDDLATLLNMCNNTAGNCRFLARPISLPPALQCGMQNICATCAEVDTVYKRFTRVYPTLTPTTVDTTEGQHAINKLFEGYMNNRLGFSKETWEYLEFRNSCIGAGYTSTPCVPGPTIGRFNSPYNDSSYTQVNSIVPTSDRGYLMAGKVVNKFTGVKNACLVKTDSVGNINWAKMYGGSNDDEFSDVYSVSNYERTAIGTTRSFNSNNKEIFIVSTDFNNNISWSKSIGSPTNNDLSGKSIIPLANGEYAFCGISGNAADSTDWVVGRLGRVFDTLGNLILKVKWMKTIGSSRHDEGGSLLEHRGMLIFSGITGDTATGYKDVVLKFNIDDGTLLNTKSYKLENRTDWFHHIDTTVAGYRIMMTRKGNWHFPELIDTNFVSLNIDYEGNTLPSSRLFRYKYTTFMTSDSIIYREGPHQWIANTTPDLGYIIMQDDFVQSPPFIGQTNKKIYLTKVNAANQVEWVKTGNIGLHEQLTAVLQNTNKNYIILSSDTAYAGLDSIYYTLENRMLLADSTGRIGCVDRDSSNLFQILDPIPLITVTTDTLEADHYITPSDSSLVLSSQQLALPGSSSPCKNCYTGYKSLFLCGSTKAVFDTTGLLSPPVDNCTDTSFFIQSKSTELYKVFLDSIKGSFDNDYVNKCMNAYRYESFTVEHGVNEYHYTLYYYDQAGNLTKTVPPAGVHPNRDSTWLAQVNAARIANSTMVPEHTMATTYGYNTLNQVTVQETPDAGQSHFWYDRLGRLALSQNARQAPFKYSYTVYDYLGRITQVGQLTSPDPIRNTISRNDDSLQQWYANAAVSREQITQTVYDLAYTPPEQWILSATNLRNRVSYSAVYNTAADLESNEFESATFYSYDIHGNVDTLVQDYKHGVMAGNGGNRFKKMVYRYDLVSGKVNHVAYQPGQRDAFYHRYSYDAENRITNVETSRDSVYWENEAWYNYYKHGPLARTVLGQNQVQGMDYAYTIQGWIKAVNPIETQSGGGDNGNGTGCGPGSAVNELVLNFRPPNGPAEYTARQLISFEAGFDSNDEIFDAQLNPELAICQPQSQGSDGGAGNNTAKDAFNYVLHYNTSDYKGINAGAPDVSVPGQLGSDYKPLYNGNISGMGVSIGKLNSPLWYNYKYDQLNRLVQMDAWKTQSTTWSALQKTLAYHEAINYDANGNITTYNRNGAATSGKPLGMDSLTYHYTTNKNQLTHISDLVGLGNYTEDIDAQAAGNYKYDAIGNLTKDVTGRIDSIKWTVYGKIESITKPGDTIIRYTYDVAGNRISKTVGTKTTWYVRDAQGNVMSTYSDGDTAVNSGHLSQTELHLYGSSRVGLLKTDLDVTIPPGSATTLPQLGDGNSFIFSRGNKLFELSNHLGNVLATVSDRKIPIDANLDGVIDYYVADVVSAQDYYPFGMLQPGRSYNAGGYRYGFNGQERSTEINDNSYTAEYWEYDSRIGRRWNLDPKPIFGISEYAVLGNNPIYIADLRGDSGEIANFVKLVSAVTQVFVYTATHKPIEQLQTAGESNITQGLKETVRQQIVSIGSFGEGILSRLTFGAYHAPFGTTGYTSSDLAIADMSKLAGESIPLPLPGSAPIGTSPQLAPVNGKPFAVPLIIPSFSPSSIVDYKGTSNDHHTDPVWAGGDSKQDLVTLPQQKHVDLHKEMNSFLKNINKKLVPAKGNPGSTIIQKFTRKYVLDKLAEFYKTPIAQSQFKPAADQFFQLHPTLK